MFLAITHTLQRYIFFPSQQNYGSHNIKFTLVIDYFLFFCVLLKKNYYFCNSK